MAERDRLTVGRLVVTLWFWGVFAISAPVCLVLGTAIWLFSLPLDPDRRALHAFLCRWVFNYLRVWPGWRARVQGRENLPQGPCVLVANHQSMADVVAVMGLFHPFKFVSKASLFSLPVVGWLMRMARYVEVERGRTRSMGRMMEACRSWLGRGMPVLLFPEGTYSPGAELLPFKRGAFALAREAGVPLVPVVIEGTRGLIHGDGPWMNPRARVSVRVLAPLSASGFGEDEAALVERVRGIFEAELRR